MLIKENDSSQQCKKNEKKLKSLSGACSNNCCRQESLIDTQLMGIILNKSRKRFSPAPNICKGESKLMAENSGRYNIRQEMRENNATE